MKKQKPSPNARRARIEARGDLIRCSFDFPKRKICFGLTVEAAEFIHRVLGEAIQDARKRAVRHE